MPIGPIDPNQPEYVRRMEVHRRESKQEVERRVDNAGLISLIIFLAFAVVAGITILVVILATR